MDGIQSEPRKTRINESVGSRDSLSCRQTQKSFEYALPLEFQLTFPLSPSEGTRMQSQSRQPSAQVWRATLSYLGNRGWLYVLIGSAALWPYYLDQLGPTWVLASCRPYDTETG